MFYNMYYRTVKKLGNPKKNRPLAGRCKMWLDITHAYRVENPDDFISLGRVCEIFLNNWMNTPYGSQ